MKPFTSSTILDTQLVCDFVNLSELILSKKEIETFRLYSIINQVIMMSKKLNYEIELANILGETVVNNIKEVIENLILKIKLQSLINDKS